MTPRRTGPSGYGSSPHAARNSLKSSWIGLMTSLKRSRNARCPAASCSLHPDRCGGIASSSISFSEHEMIRTHGLAEPLDGGEQDHVVDADHVRLDAGEDTRQVLLRPLRAVDDRLPALLDVVVDLVDRRLAEVRDVPVDEVLPELRHLLGRHGLGEVHRVGLESVALVDLDEARIPRGTPPCAHVTPWPGRCPRSSGRGRRRPRERMRTSSADMVFGLR